MRLVIQRVSEARLYAEGELFSEIQQGMVVLCGIGDSDDAKDVEWLAGKLVQMRIFGDDSGKMNLSIKDIQGSLMIVSQFTLHASTLKGNRPSFMQAAKPEHAIPLYELFISKVDVLMEKKSATGIFGADMTIHLVNDGPVTIIMDSKNKE